MQGHVLETSAKSIIQFLKNRPPLSIITQIHARIITQFARPPHLVDPLIHSYIHANNLTSARALLDNYPLPPPPTLLCNVIISSYIKLRNPTEPINLFRRMLKAGALPDEYTFTGVISSCARQKLRFCGEIVHGMVVKCGCMARSTVANSLINLFAVLGKVSDAVKVFDEMPVRDVCSWTSLLTAYAKNGRMWEARGVFLEMPARNDVSWTVMISGFVGCGMYAEALRCFHEMLPEVTPNEAVIVCALSACAHLGSLDQGDWIRGYMERNCIRQTSNISTGLIDMYAKCGKIDLAYNIFHKIPQPDVCNFTSMISGLSVHGLGEEAMQMFQLMLAKKLKPNGITIVGVLNGCSHSGLVHQGSLVFYNMENLWGITPTIEHYGCYIDMLGRAGYLAKALGILKSMPLKHDIVVWRSLLSACRVQRNVSFAERIVNHLEQLDFHTESPRAANVLLSKLYASHGTWEKVALVRRNVAKQKNQSDIGCSWIEINGIVHEFRVTEALHPQIIDIRAKLNEILERVRLDGYAADAAQVSFDIGDEEKEQAVALHSEKLAVAFGLMSTKPGATIRIVKNLRTCEDCHTILKAISNIYDREIIVRDRARFHTFKKGKCSCKDYW